MRLRVKFVIDALLSVLATAFLSASLLAQDFSQQPQTKPDPSAALVQQANDALAGGDFAAALKFLTTLNEKTPNNAEVLYDLGLATEALADSQPGGGQVAAGGGGGAAASAEAWYRRSIAANPLFAASHAALGLLLAREGHAAEAHVELLTATKVADAEPVLKGRAYRALARLDETRDPAAASAELLAALKVTAETPDDILFAAEIAEATPDLAVAEQAYRRYLAANPDGTEAVATTASLVHVLLAEHHPAEAESVLMPALAAHPGDPTLTSQLAAADLASGDPAKVAEAAPLLEKLHAGHPEDANIGRLLARVYLETGHIEQAEAMWAGIIAAQSQAGKRVDPTLLADRAEALMRLHRPGEAETLLKRAVADPAAFPTPAALADAATHLAFAAMQIDDPKGALQALRLRSTVLPPSPSTLFLEATANDTLRQSAQAIDLYKQFLAAAGGGFPDQESQARQRLAALQHRK